MRAFLVAFLVIGLAVCESAGLAQEEIAAEHPAPAAAVDALWQPTIEQLRRWVSDGMTAAGIELDYAQIPVVARMTWASLEGIDLPEDRTLRSVALITPELAANTVGFATAWQEDSWDRIQEDPERVAGELAAELSRSLAGAPLHFAVTVHGAEYPDMLGAVFYEGNWRRLDFELVGTLADYAPEEFGAPEPNALWAADYLIAQETMRPDLPPAGEIRVYASRWASDLETPADADLAAELPAPEPGGPRQARLAVGNADLFAWVDFVLY